MAKRKRSVDHPTGYVIYDGPSLLNGARIFCVATLHSSNGKTGDMIQTWIMVAEHSPIEASRHGYDAANCGDCVHRGKPTFAASGQAAGRSCYVTLRNAPLNIWRHWNAHGYPTARGHAAIAAVGRGRKVRLGAYGDMSAVPSYVADSLLSEATGHTAYSHQGDNPAASFDAARYMRSADTVEIAAAAWARGERTFRVVADISEAVAGREIACTNYTHGTLCIDCMLCDGAGKHPAAKSIVIPVHGAGAKHWEG